MVPISIDKFVASYMKNNPEEKRQDIIKSLKAAVIGKQDGAFCSQCGQPIWSDGTAIAGWNVLEQWIEIYGMNERAAWLDDEWAFVHKTYEAMELAV
ncbi:hypothetical protein, partial [Escherichia coli]|uniref:hypothetical protein n=1 Tax=Escherichia coli TaxID=562 RepID=UPI001082D046